jgi:hypothetical protein
MMDKKLTQLADRMLEWIEDYRIRLEADKEKFTGESVFAEIGRSSLNKMLIELDALIDEYKQYRYSR